MVENKLPGKRDVATGGGNYNENVEGDHIQGNKGDTIDQSGSFGVGHSEGNINAHEIAAKMKKEIGRDHNQAQTIVNIENNYASVPDVPSGEKKRRIDKLVITLEGIDFEKYCGDSDLQESILALLRKAPGGKSIEFKKEEKGSIKITLGGDPEELERLAEAIQSGELGELGEGLRQLGLSIKSSEPIFEDGTEETEEERKSRLVEEIRSQGAKGRDLSGATLSDADLSGADLSDAYLSDAYLRGANLRGANLRGANLRGAYLNGAYLNRAYLSGANLNRASLKGADLSGANFYFASVEGTIFGDNPGISRSMRGDLISRGAVFEDSPGGGNVDSPVLVPR